MKISLLSIQCQTFYYSIKCNILTSMKCGGHLTIISIFKETKIKPKKTNLSKLMQRAGAWEAVESSRWTQHISYHSIRMQFIARSIPYRDLTVANPCRAKIFFSKKQSSWNMQKQKGLEEAERFRGNRKMFLLHTKV
jgi:hypothetical protein